MTALKQVTRSLFASLAGGLLPAVVGVVATVLANRLGADADLVALLFVWTIIGYFTLSDFGLTRASSSLVANGSPARTAVATLRPSSVMIGSALSGAVTFGLVAYAWGFGATVPGVIWAMAPLPLLACAQFPLMGALEAANRFGMLAVIKSGNALSTYLVPAVLLAWGIPGLVVGVVVIYVWRVAALVWLTCVLPQETHLVEGPAYLASAVPVRDVRGLLTWLGLSSVIGPLLLYVDRAFVAGSGERDLWIFYLSCSEILLRTYIIPSSALAVFFPLTVKVLRTNPRAVTRVFGTVLPLGTLAIVVAGLAAVAVVPLSALTAVGLDPSTEPVGRAVLSTLVAGTAVNWFSQAQIALIQAQGRQRLVVVVQGGLAVPYLALLFAASSAPIVAIAGIWAGRIAMQAGVLWAVARYAPPPTTFHPAPERAS